MIGRGQYGPAAHPRELIHGVYVFAADGEQVSYLLPHGGVEPPGWVSVVPASHGAEGPRVVSADHTSIHVIYQEPPPEGELHLRVEWRR